MVKDKIKTLQKALDKLEDEYPHISLFRIKRLKDELASFRVEYDKQVHPSRKQLQEKLKIANDAVNKIDLLKEDNVADFIETADTREEIWHGATVIAQKRLLKELVSGSEETLSPEETRDVEVSERQIASGKCKTFETAQDLITDLHKKRKKRSRETHYVTVPEAREKLKESVKQK